MRKVKRDKALFTNYVTHPGWYISNNTSMTPTRTNSYSEYIDYEYVREAQKIIKNAKSDNTELPEGKTVFFDETVIYPRAKFRSAFPTNKITYNVAKADIIIIDTAKFKTKLARIYETRAKYVKLPNVSDDTFSLGYYADPLETGETKAMVHENHNYMHKGLDAVEKLLNDVFEMEGKTFLDVINLNIPSEEKLDQEGMDRIGQMLASQDNSMVNMGLRMVTAYNYETESAKIALLFNKHWYNLSKSKKINNVETMALMNKLRLDYHGFDCYDDYSKIRFWFKLALEFPEDEIIQEQVVKMTKDNFPNLPKFKIVKVDE